MEWTGWDGPRSGEFADFPQVLVAADVPSVAEPEPSLIDFALTFDGYAALGNDTLGKVAQGARKAWNASGELPNNLVLLRCCLFFEQRAARHRATELGEPYVEALLQAIRTFAAGTQ